MNRLRICLGALGPLAVLTSVLLLVGALWITGVHHHGPETGHSCPVCTTAHSPAITSIAVTGIVAPHVADIRFEDLGALVPAKLALGIAPSRAPPTA